MKEGNFLRTIQRKNRAKKKFLNRIDFSSYFLRNTILRIFYLKSRKQCALLFIIKGALAQLVHTRGNVTHCWYQFCKCRTKALSIKERTKKFTREHPCRNMISIKLQSNFIEIRLRHGCSPVNLLHIFRTFFHRNPSGGLLLFYQQCHLCMCFLKVTFLLTGFKMNKHCFIKLISRNAWNFTL